MFSSSELEAYLDEALPAEEMSRIEQAVRGDREVMRQLASIHARREAGACSLGAVWRRRRLSCPTREELGSCLLGALDEGLAGYIAFHVEVVGCRYCQANLADLRAQQEGAETVAGARRRKYFQSSAKHLPRPTGGSIQSP
jgi:hypothetical protein